MGEEWFYLEHFIEPGKFTYYYLTLTSQSSKNLQRRGRNEKNTKFSRNSCRWLFWATCLGFHTAALLCGTTDFRRRNSTEGNQKGFLLSTRGGYSIIIFQPRYSWILALLFADSKCLNWNTYVDGLQSISSNRTISWGLLRFVTSIKGPLSAPLRWLRLHLGHYHWLGY